MPRAHHQCDNQFGEIGEVFDEPAGAELHGEARNKYSNTAKVRKSNTETKEQCNCGIRGMARRVAVFRIHIVAGDMGDGGWEA